MIRRALLTASALLVIAAQSLAPMAAMAAPVMQEPPVAPAAGEEQPIYAPALPDAIPPEVVVPPSPVEALASPVEDTQAEFEAASAMAAPPDRATRFGLEGGITYSHQEYFAPASPFTIEAWVYLFDTSQCKTILDHGFGASYWFGVCPAPRLDFGPNFSTADVQLNQYQWTHVAASWDGTNTSFYVNGVAAGVKPLAPGLATTNTLTIGEIAGPPASTFMRGVLDEVRLWSVARTQAQIQAFMYKEIRASGIPLGLSATFGDGGQHEDLHNLSGAVGANIDSVKWGVLPRELIVPRAAVTPTLDANIAYDFEYAGAEAMPVRMVAYGAGIAPAGPDDEDIRAYMVHTETDLWIGIPTASLFAPSWDQETSWIGVLLDPNASRDETIQPTDFRLKIPVNDTNPATAVWQIGDGAGGWVDCTDPGCPQRGTQWDIAKRIQGEFPVVTTVEIRISKSLLGEWSEVDGMALGQFLPGPPEVGFVGPLEAEDQSPATWGIVSYGEGSASLPRAIVRGKVLNFLAPGSPPLAGHKVTFGRIGSIIYEHITDSNGEFEFDVRMPANQLLTLRAGDCSFCRFNPATISGVGVSPAVAGNQVVTYPGCAGGACLYRSATFNLKFPPGEVTLLNPPAPPVAELILNTANGEKTPDTQYLLKGANLHDEITVFLSPDTASTNPGDWVLYQANVTGRSTDMTSLTVEMPTLPRFTPTKAPNLNVGSSLGIQWRWVIKDNWSRIGWKDAFRSSTFRLVRPPFPVIDGFGFKNEDDNGSYYEFLSVYGDNAYICIGAFGFCATHIIDPIYASIYFGLYKLMIGQSGGSCVGMASTSLLLQRGTIPIGSLDPSINYGFGFKAKGSPPNWHFDGALGFLTSPPEPVDLWAHIRRNHGVQISGQVWGKDIAVQLIDSTTDGFIQRQRDKIASGPLGYVLSMKNPNKVFGGHAVTPYAVVGDRVLVYDNNRQGNASLYVDFNTADDTFTFPRSSDTWTGGTLFTFPLERWTQERNFPTNITGMLSNLVFGEGDGGTTALFSSSAGEWGVRPDGTFVETMPGAVGIPILGQSGESVDFSPVLLPMTGPAPQITINAKDSAYQALAGQGAAEDAGTSLAVRATNVTPGDTDGISLTYSSGVLSGFELAPQRATTDLLPKVGMELGLQQRLLFQFWQIDVGQGGSARFDALPAAHGVTYGNESGEASKYKVIVDSVDGAAQKVGTHVFEPPVVPPGGVQRLTVADWPAGTTLKVEIDANGDGVFENSRNITGRSCASLDLNEDGLPDACALDRSLYMPVITR